jgi:hypothetical protein
VCVRVCVCIGVLFGVGGGGGGGQDLLILHGEKSRMMLFLAQGGFFPVVRNYG